MRGAEVWLLRESGGEFGVGNVGEDVGDVTFNRVVRGKSGGFGRTGRSELGETGLVSRLGGDWGWVCQ